MGSTSPAQAPAWRRRSGWPIALVLALGALAPAPALGATLGATLGAALLPPEASRWEQDNVTGAATAVLGLPDGGFVVAGASRGEWVLSGSTVVEIEPSIAYVAGYDAAGRNRWFTVVDEGVFDTLHGLASLPDGTVLAAGTVRGAGKASWGWLHAFDAAGAPVWSRNLSEPSADATELRSVFMDGADVVVAGTVLRSSGPVPMGLPYLVRLGADGEERERHVLDHLLGQVVFGAAAGPVPGSVFLAGSNTTSAEGCVTRLDGTALLWQHCDRGAAQYYVDVDRRGDGAPGAVAAGYRQGEDTHAATVWIDGAAAGVRHFDEGVFNARYAAVAVVALPDGGAAVVVANGTTVPLTPVLRFAEAAMRGELHGDLSTVVVRYTAEGDVAGAEEFRRLGTLMPLGGSASADGGVLVAGLSADASAQQYHPFVLHTTLP